MIYLQYFQKKLTLFQKKFELFQKKNGSFQKNFELIFYYELSIICQ